MKKAKGKWLEEGYKHFALCGPQSLSIKKISESLGASRASFYHYFGDLDVFTEELLGMHLKVADSFHEKPKDVSAENWLPINREDVDITVSLRIYGLDLEKMKTWKALRLN